MTLYNIKSYTIELYVHVVKNDEKLQWYFKTYSFQVIFELFEAIVARDVWSDDVNLVHVSCQQEGGPSSNPTPPAQEK